MTMPTPEPPRQTWRKSSYSGDNGGQCVEVAVLTDDATHHVGIRDSKNPTGPILTVTPAGWTHFVTALRTGQLPRRHG
jgi:hypothetical protein